MKIFVIIVVLTLVSVATSLPPADSPTIPFLVDFAFLAPRHDVQFPVPPKTLPSQYPWQAPDISKQSRSPCPMLNSLANHGMLPRDGRNISSDMFADALKKNLNLQWDFWWVIANTAIKAVKPGATYIDLHDLAFHNGIQHDAALTRNDKGQGQYFTRPNVTLIDQLLAFNDTALTYIDMARARRLREGQSEAWNENYTLPGQSSYSIAKNKWFLAIDQAAVPLLVLSDNIPGENANTGLAPVDRLRTFFTYERLPYENGWYPSQYELSWKQIFDGIKLVAHLYTSGPDVVESPSGLDLDAGGPPYNPNPDY